MKKNTILFLILFSLFASCGEKKDTKNHAKDSVEVKVEATLQDPKPIDEEEKEVVVVDSSDVMTNTEILNEKGQLDPNSSPMAVVQTMIKAARTKNYGPLLKLCNESIDMDGDAKDVCGIASAKKSDQDDFNEFFGNAKIISKPRIKNGIAEVDIASPVEGGSKETIICQVKYDKWYLKGF